jgi:hypothetical protein
MLFDRFTDRARKVLGLSRLAALDLRHDCIEEHILLGEGKGVAAKALAACGVTADAVRKELGPRNPLE